MNSCSRIISAALVALVISFPAADTFAGCCVGTTGNVDGSLDGVVDISDVFAMVDFLGTSTPLSSCADANDVNVDGLIDISDLFAEIDYLSGSAALPWCPGMVSDPVTDIDGNVYQTVVVGAQIWMAENLRVTHYRNGEAIPYVREGIHTWGSLAMGAYGHYKDDAGNAATYGNLYNWFAANDGRNIAPVGWHVPSDAEWQALIDRLGGDAIAGGKMKETGFAHWWSPNASATNEKGLAVLPAGGRMAANDFLLGAFANFWSTTLSSADVAWARRLFYDQPLVFRGDQSCVDGYSIRCVKD